MDLEEHRELHPEEHEEIDYEAAGQDPGVSVPGFVGKSERRYRSTADDFHLAIQRAAKAAAQHQGEPEEWYELSRIQVKVSKNPNVKLYSVMLTKTTGDDG